MAHIIAIPVVPLMSLTARCRLKVRQVEPVAMESAGDPAFLHDTAVVPKRHRLFNPAPPEATLEADRLKTGGLDPAMDTHGFA